MLIVYSFIRICKLQYRVTTGRQCTYPSNSIRLDLTHTDADSFRLFRTVRDSLTSFVDLQAMNCYEIRLQIQDDEAGRLAG